MEDFSYEMEMEWKKIASMEYGKIVFHSISYHACCAEHRLDCLQSEILGGVCDGFCVQPISALNLGYATKYAYVTALLYKQCNIFQHSYIM